MRLRLFAVVAMIICEASAGHALAAKSVLIVINKSSQKMTVTVDGEETYKWLVSTGASGYSTPSGSYRPFRMERDHFSKEWDDAPMPYSIFFTGEGHAIHGSYETRNLGRPASHGCVRIAPKNAEKLFALVKREGMEKARVVVLNDPNAPVVSKRRTPAQEASTAQQSRKTASNPAAATPALPPSAQMPGYAPQQAYGYVRSQPMVDTQRGPYDTRDPRLTPGLY